MENSPSRLSHYEEYSVQEIKKIKNLQPSSLLFSDEQKGNIYKKDFEKVVDQPQYEIVAIRKTQE